MSGGSSGGSSNKKSDKKKDEPVIPGTGPMMTQQPFMPGMDTALAQQLAAGYGGDPASFLAQFAQTYAPMQVLDTRPGAAGPGTPGTPSTPSTGSTQDLFQRLKDSGSKALGRGAYLDWGNR